MHEPAVRLEPHSHHFTCSISLLDIVKLEACLSSGSTSGRGYLLLVCHALMPYLACAGDEDAGRAGAARHLAR